MIVDKRATKWHQHNILNCVKFEGKRPLEIDLQRIDRLRNFDFKVTNLRFAILRLVNKLIPSLDIESQVAVNLLEISLVI